MTPNRLNSLIELDLSTECLPEDLRLSSDGRYSTYYAPFEYINRNAKIVVCGITPGKHQALEALRTAQAKLKAGASAEAALESAKHAASFAGPMRKNLIELLDFIGLNQWLQLDTCEALFSHRQDLIHFTSALRNPVFENGENFSGGNAMVRKDYLWNQINAGLREEISALPDTAIFVPLGRGVDQVFESLINEGLIGRDRILAGLPHPSGANAERIAYFLNRKSASDLSAKTSAATIDAARTQLEQQISHLLRPKRGGISPDTPVGQSSGSRAKAEDDDTMESNLRRPTILVENGVMSRQLQDAIAAAASGVGGIVQSPHSNRSHELVVTMRRRCRIETLYFDRKSYIRSGKIKVVLHPEFSQEKEPKLAKIPSVRMQPGRSGQRETYSSNYLAFKNKAQAKEDKNQHFGHAWLIPLGESLEELSAFFRALD